MLNVTVYRTLPFISVDAQIGIVVLGVDGLLHCANTLVSMTSFPDFQYLLDVAFLFCCARFIL